MARALNRLLADMKIMIIGSMSFVKDMIAIKKDLSKLEHKASIPLGTEPHQKDSSFVDNLEENLKFCIKNNVMKRNFDLVAQSDAVLVLNHKKNGVDGYIGVSVLMEMAIAHHLNKKIFILNNIPHFKDVRWAHEVAIIQPTIINGDLTKIN